NSAPMGRAEHAAVYDPSRKRMLMFGGTMGARFDDAPIGDLWSLSLDGAPEWTQLSTGDPAVGARAGAVAILDSRRDRLILAGTCASNSDCTDVFALDLVDSKTWSMVGAHEGIVLNSGAYDRMNDRLILRTASEYFANLTSD